MKTLFRALIAISCASLPASAQTVVLNPSADTAMFESFPDNNLGRVMSLAAGTTGMESLTRALIKFDIAGHIPANVNVTRARLRLTVVRIPPIPQPSTFTLRRVLQDWGEGNKSFGNLGEAASEGEATWNNRFHPSTPWENAGGAPGVDFSDTASSSALVTGLGTVLFDTSPQMIADVQGWLADPTQNFGWLLVSESEGTTFTARRFGAREDAVNAPALEIDYASPMRIGNVALTNSAIRFTFPVEPLFTYTVESRGSLSSGAWDVLTNFTETVSSYDAAIFDAVNAPTRFYRILKAPCNCQ